MKKFRLAPPININIFSKLIPCAYNYKRSYYGILERKYKVYAFLFFKLKFRVPAIDGKNNKIYIKENGERKELVQLLPQIKVIIEGNNNIIELGEIKHFQGLSINIRGDNNKVIIADTEHQIKFSSISMEQRGNNRRIIIGRNWSCNGALITIGNNSSIDIGADCMFAYGLYLSTTDHHPIYDKFNKALFPNKDIKIGNHVWLGRNVSVHKGAVIPDGCVVGANSFVTKEFTEPDCILAGTPAKIIKHNIRWERDYDTKPKIDLQTSGTP